MPTLTPSTNHLYAITDSAYQGDALYQRVSDIVRGGAALVQYRDKTDEHERRRREAATLNEICRAADARLIINDDPALAKYVGAAGVHLGQTDQHLHEARQLLGPDAIIGITCHASLALAEQAVAGGADYLAFGRFFPSRTKPGAPPAPLELLTQARRRWPHQTLVAIGGITRGTAPEVLGAGADYAALCHGVLTSTAPTDYTRAFARMHES